MKNLLKLSIFSCLFVVIFPLHAWAQIVLPDLFSDHMVLQRETPIPVWGTAPADALVEVTLNKHTIKVQSDYFGAWKVSLPSMKTGGPYELIISSVNEKVRIKDIYIGEVWICSGQSNMEWALGQTAEGEIEIPKANFPLIRLFHLKKKHDTYKTPYSKEQLVAFSEGQFFHQAQWELCSPETAAMFSGLGYFFGKTLQDSLNVPIGLIQAAVGGSPAQSWISKTALASHSQMKHLVEGKQGWLNSPIIHPWLAERAKENWVNWEETKKMPLPGHPFAPHYLFDAAITPIAPYAIRGALWYQGESNATHPKSYPVMIELMLKSWRTLWGQGDFPFYFVQLPKIGNRNLWAEFREAQQEGLSIPNTGMVVTLDQGHPTDVHPREKEVIGQRLAYLALAKTYHRSIAAESPRLLSYNWKKAERKIILRFKNTFEGLNIKKGNIPKGIYLQGYLKQGSLEAIIPPDKIIITDDEITITYLPDFLPVKVKYAWASYPENNLINSAGLPLAPFKIELEGLN